MSAFVGVSVAFNVGVIDVVDVVFNTTVVVVLALRLLSCVHAVNLVV